MLHLQWIYLSQKWKSILWNHLQSMRQIWKVRWTLGFNFLKKIILYKKYWESLTHKSCVKYNFTLFFCRMIQRGKERHEVHFSNNLAGKHWPHKQLLFLHGGPLQECNCNHGSRPSFIHHPGASHTHYWREQLFLRVSQTVKKTLKIQITISEVELRRETHTKRPQWSVTSKILDQG